MADIFDLFRKISKETPAATPISWLIVGLGNPGVRYQWTRHNAGFLAMDALVARHGGNPDRAKFDALVGETTIAGKRVLLMKPQTFMNASGDAVEAAMKFYKLAPSRLLVLSDDISLDVGKLRVRKSGSAGGQKGLNSIIEALGTQEFPRIRIGVGQKPSPDYDLADWVLSVFTPEQREHLQKNTFPLVCDGVEKLLSDDLDGAMQHCNGKGGI
ncbi:MAG: aminoacyl-tRNA hydrolase [Clostridia bacterium]|nr:aminoacyl-tRNA hydrolase [Clostridia bacterium]